MACAALMLLVCCAPRSLADTSGLSMDRPAQPIDPAEHAALAQRAGEDTNLLEIRSGQDNQGMMQAAMLVLLVVVLVAAAVAVAEANQDEEW